MNHKKLKRDDASPEKSPSKVRSVVKPPVVISEEEVALFESIMSYELDANGGATVLAVSQKDIDEKLVMPNVPKKELLKKFSIYFLTQVYSESKSEEDDDLSKK